MTSNQNKLRSQTIEQLLQPFDALLRDAEITELRIRPGTVVAEAFGKKTYLSLPEINDAYLRGLAVALISYAGLTTRPVNYLTLPGGQRGTVLMPPAVANDSIMIVIRNHSAVVKTLDELEREGAFSAVRDVSFNLPSAAEAATAAQRADFQRLEGFEVELLDLKRKGAWRGFLDAAVKHKRNIVIAGKTGSGKTTLARSLMESVPVDEHIATIEDVHELFLPNHKEVTHLFYGGEGGRISALSCLEACMRLTPDRIFLAELRGGEAWEYTNSLNTDHGGGITTTHANGAIETFDRIATLIKNSDVGVTLQAEAIRQTLYATIDIVLFVRCRSIEQIFYDPAFKKCGTQWRNVGDTPTAALALGS